jgi:hypothetical protein
MKRQPTDSLSSPRRRATTALRWLRWAAPPALCLFLAPSAFAYCSDWIEWLTFPQITVASDGNEYTGVTGIGYGWEGRVSIECEGLSRVKSWSLHPWLTVEGMDSPSFAPYKQGKSYPIGKRPKSVHRTVGSIFPAGFVRDYATAACNRHLQQLMNQGLSRAQVLHQKRIVAARYGGHLDADYTLDDESIQQAHPGWDTEIVCDKSPVQPLKPLKPPKPASGDVTTTGALELVDAGLIVFPGSYSGQCPKELTLFLKVQANHTGTFEARVESTEGWKSTKVVHKTTDFDANSGLWGKQFSVPFTVPVQQPNAGGGSGAIGQQASGNFQLEPTPGDGYVPPTSGPQGAAGGFAPADPGSNVHKQSLRLVAVANGKTVYSDWEQYSVTCDPKPAIKPATTAFLPGGTGGGPTKPGDTDRKPGKPTPDKPEPKPGAPRLDADGQGAKKKPGGKAPAPKLVQPKPPQAPGAPSRAKPESDSGAPAVVQAVVVLPDLRVVRARRSAKSPEKIEFLVENAGRAAAGKSSASLTCARPGGGAESWSAPVPAIAAGGQVWVETSPEKARQVPTRVRGCQIAADPANVIPESNDGNNELSCGGCAAASRAPGR